MSSQFTISGSGCELYRRISLFSTTGLSYNLGRLDFSIVACCDSFLCHKLTVVLNSENKLSYNLEADKHGSDCR